MAWRDIYYTVHDGLRLHARDYGNRNSPLLPVVCLAGLTRNSRDFHDLAVALAPERRVLALDYRGRGLSDYADDWRTYTPQVELSDTLALMSLAGIEDAAIIGTSRGGIVAMLMAAARPSAMKAVVLNDIGPEIASQGLLRIRGYLEHAPVPADWNDATDILRKINHGFDNLTNAEWRAYARRVFRDVRGKPRSDHDPQLKRTFITYADVVYDRIPTLWPQFAALSHLPTLIVRGQNSDLLSPEIIEKMRIVHPAMQTITVADRGHAPFLNEPNAIEAITALLRSADPAQLLS